MAVKLAAAEAQVEGLKVMLAEVRASRDRELERAERRLQTDQRQLGFFERLFGRRDAA